MNSFHICFPKEKVGEEVKLCTGINVSAKTVEEALSKFREEFGDIQIIYVSQKLAA